jgi:hypothetical protein
MVISLPYNGSVPNWNTCTCVRSSSQLGGPFDFCAFAYAFTMVLLGSLVIALKCTRPRQRFIYVIGRYSMRERRMSQGRIFMGLCNKSDNEERCVSQVRRGNKNELNEIWKMNKRNKSGTSAQQVGESRVQQAGQRTA